MPSVALVEAPLPKVVDYSNPCERLLTTATILTENGIDAKVYEDIADVPCGPGVEYVVILANILQYIIAIRIARQHRGYTTILCGDYVSTSPALAMGGKGFEFGIVGDPEIPILKLVNGTSKSKIAGLVWRDFGALVRNPNLDFRDFPIIDYGLWQGEWQGEVGLLRSREFTVDGDLVVRRGKSGLKTNAHFKEEILRLKERGTKHIVVTDADFCSAGGMVKGAIKALGVFRSWSCTTTTRTALKSKLGESLVDSGCNKITLRLKTINKRFAGELNGPLPREHELVCGQLKRAVGNVLLNVTIGYPGETITSLTETRDWLSKKAADGFGVRVSTFVPVPGMAEYNSPPAQFNFDVTGTNCGDFWVDDDDPNWHSIPWSSGVIDRVSFLRIRRGMVREFNRG